MDTWRYFINFATDYISSHNAASERYMTFSSKIKDCVNSPTEGLVKAKLKATLNSDEINGIYVDMENDLEKSKIVSKKAE